MGNRKCKLLLRTSHYLVIANAVTLYSVHDNINNNNDNDNSLKKIFQTQNYISHYYYF